jgi:hypothetical protein
MATVKRHHKAQTSAAPMPPPGQARRRLRAAVLAAAVTSPLAGCQESLDVSALNHCGHDVEARAESIPEVSISWSKIESDGRDHIASAVDQAEQLYVEVRTNKDTTPVEFVVDVEDLPQPPEGVNDDVEIVLEGDRCPGPAD